MKGFIKIFSLLVLFFIGINAAQALVFPNDPYYKNQWYLNHINLPAAWDYTQGSESVVVAVIDSGVDINHPDLRENIWVNSDEIKGDGIDNDENGYVDDVNGWDFINNIPDPLPKYSAAGFTNVGMQHGTVIAGVLAARGNNGEGVAGVSWRSKIMPLRAMNSFGSGDANTVIRAIDYAVDNGAQIINMSFVGFADELSLKQTVERAYNKGVLIVAAGGNNTTKKEGDDLDLVKMYPICFNDSVNNLLLGVSSTDANDQKARFSNYGSCVNISAPGIDFFSTEFLDKKFGFNESYGGNWSGTSLATPLISGTAALIKSFKPNYSVEKIIKLILENSQPIDDKNPFYVGKLGKGRLNTEKIFLAMAQENNEEAMAPAIAPEPAQWKDEIKLLVSGEQGFPADVKFFQNSGVIKEWPVLVNFKGGINIASGDLDANGAREIVAAVASSGGPQVRIFSESGQLLGQFMAYRESFRGGVSIAVGDCLGDSGEEIITAPASDNVPEVRIFNSRGELLKKFLAFSESFRGGVNLSAGDLNGDGQDEIIAAPASKGGPQVRIFNGGGEVLWQFFAFDQKLRGGLNASVLK
ncbi:MAG: S8 family peptidase [Patescibacteria group bacterium]|nr:S8 family peptidase [Patescibacteria group bacterium]